MIRMMTGMTRFSQDARPYSALHLIPEAAWRKGLHRLQQDLACRPVPGTARYACLWGCKPPHARTAHNIPPTATSQAIE